MNDNTTSKSELLVAVGECLATRSLVDADHLVHLLQKKYPDDPVILTILARIMARRKNQRNEMLTVANRMLQLPQSALSFCALGEISRSLGQEEDAVSMLEKSLDMHPLPAAFEALIELLLPGPCYLKALELAHSLLTPKCYLEIGVSNGDSWKHARQSERVIGIDPSDDSQRLKKPPHYEFFQTTSDEFFAKYARTTLKSQSVNFAFIDGMHIFEFALRDFLNTERYLAPGAWIALHDTVPVHPSIASRDRFTGCWTGDIWKMLHYLLQYRKDLQVKTLLLPPSGLTFVTGFGSASEKSPPVDNIAREYAELKPPPIANLRERCKIIDVNVSNLETKLRGVLEVSNSS